MVNRMIKIKLTNEEVALLSNWIGCWTYVFNPPNRTDLKHEKMFQNIMRKLKCQM